MKFKSYVITELYVKKLLEHIVDEPEILKLINHVILRSSGSYCTFLKDMLTVFLSYSFNVADENASFTQTEAFYITSEFRQYLGQYTIQPGDIYYIDGYDIFYHRTLFDLDEFNTLYYEVIYNCVKESMLINKDFNLESLDVEEQLISSSLFINMTEKITTYFSTLVDMVETTIFHDFSSLEMGQDIFFLPELQRNRLIIHVKVPKEERTCRQPIPQKVFSSD